MKSNLVDTKSLLAKLLATENINIQHRPCKTASFDLKTRTLYCPIWADMTGIMYDLLMGHEISHALFTPQEGWKDALENHPKKQSFVGFLNVVEDARIERKIKEKFPGLRKSFFLAYKNLCDRDFFGIAKLADVGSEGYKSLNLIDRINIHCKCVHLKIPFVNEKELDFVKRVETIQNWESVPVLAQEIYDYVKENEKDKPQSTAALEKLIEQLEEMGIKPNYEDFGFGEKQESDSFDEDEEGEDYNDSTEDDNDPSEQGDGDEESEDSDESDDSEGSGEEESDEDAEEEKDSLGKGDIGAKSKEDKNAKGAVDSGKEGGKNTGNSEITDEEPHSLTDETFRERELELLDLSSLPVYYLDLPKCDLKNTVVPYDIMLKTWENGIGSSLMLSYSDYINVKIEYAPLTTKLTGFFNQRNKKYISLLAKEFEMRKNANQYARRLIAKTGELDTRKLDRYKFTNDIFRKVTTVQKGKSHGMILFLDMSGSMHQPMRNVVEQLLILTSFCQRVNIPFDVYGFADTGSSRYDGFSRGNQFVDSPSAMDINMGSFHLRHLLSSRMNPRMYKRAFNMMLVFGEFDYFSTAGSELMTYIKDTYKINYPASYHAGSNMSSCGMGMGGTPFIQTLIASRPIIDNFKKDTQSDIVNVIYLTDGDGNGAWNPSKNALMEGYDHRKAHFGIVDPITKKRIMINSQGMQETLTQFIKQITHCRHIGFFVGSRGDIRNRVRYSLQVSMADVYKKKGLQVPRDMYPLVVDKANELFKNIKNDGFVSYPCIGYDNYYYLLSNSDNVDDGELEIDSGMTKNQMAKEFIKHQNKKKSGRVLLSKFSEEICTAL